MAAGWSCPGGRLASMGEALPSVVVQSGAPGIHWLSSNWKGRHGWSWFARVADHPRHRPAPLRLPEAPRVGSIAREGPTGVQEGDAGYGRGRAGPGQARRREDPELAEPTPS